MNLEKTVAEIVKILKKNFHGETIVKEDTKRGTVLFDTFLVSYSGRVCAVIEEDSHDHHGHWFQSIYFQEVDDSSGRSVLIAEKVWYDVYQMKFFGGKQETKEELHSMGLL